MQSTGIKIEIYIAIHTAMYLIFNTLRLATYRIHRNFRMTKFTKISKTVWCFRNN